MEQHSPAQYNAFSSNDPEECDSTLFCIFQRRAVAYLSEESTTNDTTLPQGNQIADQFHCQAGFSCFKRLKSQRMSCPAHLTCRLQVKPQIWVQPKPFGDDHEWVYWVALSRMVRLSAEVSAAEEVQKLSLFMLLSWHAVNWVAKLTSSLNWLHISFLFSWNKWTMMARVYREYTTFWIIPSANKLSASRLS